MEHYYKTFVSVGNAKQPYERLLNAVQANIILLPKPILIQCGHTPFLSNECDVIDFINMDVFVNYIAKAEILITHAGAGSVLHAVRAGKRPILMPRREKFNEHVNDHQVEFAKTLHSTGKILMVDNEKELECAIKQLHEKIVAPMHADYKPEAFKIIKNTIQHILKG